MVEVVVAGINAELDIGSLAEKLGSVGVDPAAWLVNIETAVASGDASCQLQGLEAGVAKQLLEVLEQAGLQASVSANEPDAATVSADEMSLFEDIESLGFGVAPDEPSAATAADAQATPTEDDALSLSFDDELGDLGDLSSRVSESDHADDDSTSAAADLAAAERIDEPAAADQPALSTESIAVADELDESSVEAGDATPSEATESADLSLQLADDTAPISTPRQSDPSLAEAHTASIEGMSLVDESDASMSPAAAPAAIDNEPAASAAAIAADKPAAPVADLAEAESVDLDLTDAGPADSDPAESDASADLQSAPQPAAEADHTVAGGSLEDLLNASTAPEPPASPAADSAADSPAADSPAVDGPAVKGSGGDDALADNNTRFESLSPASEVAPSPALADDAALQPQRSMVEPPADHSAETPVPAEPVDSVPDGSTAPEDGDTAHDRPSQSSPFAEPDSVIVYTAPREHSDRSEELREGREKIAKIKDRIDADREEEEVVSRTLKLRRRVSEPKFLAVASVALLAAGIGGWFTLSGPGQNAVPVADIQSEVQRVATSVKRDPGNDPAFVVAMARLEASGNVAGSSSAELLELIGAALPDAVRAQFHEVWQLEPAMGAAQAPTDAASSVLASTRPAEYLDGWLHRQHQLNGYLELLNRVADEFGVIQGQAVVDHTADSFLQVMGRYHVAEMMVKGGGDVERNLLKASRERYAIKAPAERVIAIAGGALTQMRIGNTAVAEDAFLEASILGGTLVEPAERLIANSRIARQMVAAGDLHGATKHIDYAQAAQAALPQTNEVRDLGHRQLAADLAVSGFVGKALAEIEKIDDPYIAVPACMSAAAAFSQRDDRPSARNAVVLAHRLGAGIAKSAHRNQLLERVTASAR